MIRTVNIMSLTSNSADTDVKYEKALQNFSTDKSKLIRKLVDNGELRKLDICNQSISKELLLEDYKLATKLDSDKFELIARV